MVAETTFVGGLRGPGGVHASPPLARLTIDPATGVVVSVVKAFGWLPGLRPRRFGWADLDSAEEVLEKGTVRGVRLNGLGARWVVFRTQQPEDVLLALSSAGVTIRPNETPPRI